MIMNIWYWFINNITDVVSIGVGIISFIVCIKMYVSNIESNINMLKADYINSIYTFEYPRIDNKNNIDDLITKIKSNKSKSTCKELKYYLEKAYKNNYSALMILKEIVRELKKCNRVKHFIIYHTYYKIIYKNIDGMINELLEIYNMHAGTLIAFLDNRLIATGSETELDIINKVYKQMTYAEVIDSNCKIYIPIVDVCKDIIEFIVSKNVNSPYWVLVGDILEFITDSKYEASKLVVFGEIERQTYNLGIIDRIKNIKTLYYVVFNNVNEYRYSRGLKCNRKFRECKVQNQIQVDH